MISVITCSVKPLQRTTFAENVADTIGITYEYICIDNTRNQYSSLTKAYNAGAARARFPILCFVHEDVLFRSRQWGQKLMAHLNEPSVGVVGLAGCCYKTRTLSTWLQPKLDGVDYNRCHFIQSGVTTTTPELRVMNPENEKLAEVVCVDGFFMAFRRDVFEAYQFNSKLNFFHGYDFDFCIRSGTRYRHFVAMDILAEHFSSGTINQEWFRNYLFLHWKYRRMLPIKGPVVSASVRSLQIAEDLNARFFRKLLLEKIQPFGLQVYYIFFFSITRSYGQSFFGLIRNLIKDYKILLRVRLDRFL